MFKNLREDIQVVKSKDAAAGSTFDILLNATGMRAVWRYRRHHWLWTHGFKRLARFLATRSRNKFGIEIHPGAQIGRRFMIDHGMGVVIGETAVIGDDCLLYQGVTLGGTGKELGKRHPTLGNKVIVGVGASVLGNIYLCDGVKVGGGAVVVKDVLQPCTVVGVPAHSTSLLGARIPSQKDYCPVDTYLEGPLAIERRENVDRKEYLPDPILNHVNVLEQRIKELERCLESLEERSPCKDSTANIEEK